MTTDSKTTRQIVTRFHNAFVKHRPEDLDDLIGEGCVLENTAPAPDGARYEGREACLDFWKGIASSANLVFQAQELWASEDRGIIRWQLRWSESEAIGLEGEHHVRAGRKNRRRSGIRQRIDMPLRGVLKGKNLQLRQASAEDVEARLSLGNHAEIVEMFGGSRGAVRPLTRDDAMRWVQRLIDHSHAWVIEVHGRLIGEIRLDNVVLHDRRASMAVGILDPTLLGKGLGSEAIFLILRHAFSDLQLHRIGVRVLAYNQRAIRAYERCGFVVEGREREAAFVNGAWHDDVLMGLLEHEFLSRNS